MLPIDITKKTVTVKQGFIELRTARGSIEGWPYLPWILGPNEDGSPGVIILNHEKGEIIGQSQDAEYTIEPTNK